MWSLNVCPTCDGETFSIWKAFDREALFSDVCLINGLPLGDFGERSLQGSDEGKDRERSTERRWEKKQHLFTTVCSLEEYILLIMIATWMVTEDRGVFL